MTIEYSLNNPRGHKEFPGLIRHWRSGVEQAGTRVGGHYRSAHDEAR